MRRGHDGVTLRSRTTFAKDTSLLRVRHYTGYPFLVVAVHGDLDAVAIDVLFQDGAQVAAGGPGLIVVLIVHSVAQFVVLRVLSQQFRQDNVPLVPERLAAVSQTGLRARSRSER